MSSTALDPNTAAMLGQQVELAQIGREIKKLWESSGGTQTRASLVNFAVYGKAANLAENNALISDFTREHSCRAILIAHDRQAPGPTVQSWINAHCHVARAGAKHICCEQITLLIQGGSNELLDNILFANLDSDLPLYLWWQGELSETTDRQLWGRVDRLIFDSREWDNCQQQFSALQRSLKHAGSQLILCDLNWTRTLHLRQGVAQLFDHPENLAQLARVTHIGITHAPGHCSTVLLFAAWIAAQLRWTFQSRNGSEITYTNSAGGTVTYRLQEAAGAPVSRCEFSTGDATFAISRDAGSPFHRSEIRLADGSVYQHLLPAGSDEIGGLLDEELTLGGRHRVYLKALAAAEALM